jgi:hypothetical protein
MPLIMERQNVNFFLSSWQNQDVDMSGMASNFPEMWKKLRNKTKNCGEAINQLSAYQFIIAKVGTAVDAAKNPTGSRIAVRCEKNSYGAPDREITYELRTNYAMDTDTYSEPVFHYGEWFAKFMADRKLLGTQSDSKLFSCKAYGLIGLTAPDFERQFMMIPDAVAYLGKQLRIDGFDPTVDEIRAAIGEVTGEEPPAPPAPTTLVPPPPPTAEEMAVINAKSAASGAEETESNNEDTTAGERVSPE